MKRRTMLVSAMAACGGLFVPWKANGGQKCSDRPKNELACDNPQVVRIRKLLDLPGVRWYFNACIGATSATLCTVGFTKMFGNVKVACAGDLDSDINRIVAGVVFKDQTAERMNEEQLVVMIGKGLQRSAAKYQRDKRLSVTEWIEA